MCVNPKKLNVSGGQALSAGKVVIPRYEFLLKFGESVKSLAFRLLVLIRSAHAGHFRVAQKPRE